MASNATVVGALRVLLTADTAQFEKALEGVDKDTKKLANTLARDLEPSQRRVNAVMREFLGTKEIGQAEAYARAVQQIGGANNLTERDQRKVNAAMKEALSHYKALGKDGPANIKALEAATRGASTSTSDLIGKAKGVLGAFGIGVGVGAFVSFGKSIIDTADHIGDLSTKMGVSAEAAQRFERAAKLSGSSIDDVSTAVVQMSKNLVVGDKSTVAALASVGLSVENLRGMKPEAAFRTIADAIEGLPDSMKQAQVSMELFGKGGANLLTMFRDGSLAVTDGMKVMSEETVRTLKNAQDTWKTFWDNVTIYSAEALSAIFGSPNNPNLRRRESPTRPSLSAIDVIPFAPSPTADPKAQWRDLQKLWNTGPGMLAEIQREYAAGAEKRAAAETKLAEIEKARQERYVAFKAKYPGYLTPQELEQMKFAERFAKEDPLSVALMKRADAYAILNLQAGRYNNLLKAAPLPKDFLTVTSTPGKLPDALNASGTRDNTFRWAPSPQATVSLQDYADVITILTGNMQRFSTTSSRGWQLTADTTSQAVQAVLGYRMALRAAGDDAAKMTAANQAFGASAAAMLTSFGVNLVMMGIGWDQASKARVAAARKEIQALRKELLEVGIDEAASERFVIPFLIANPSASRNDALQALLERVRKVGTEISTLKNQLVDFGGVVPSALRPAIESLLTATNLPAGLRKELEGLAGKPAWQVAQQRAESLGIALDRLGAGFQQSRLGSIALGFVRDLEMFKDIDADMTGVLEGMSDELSELAQQALKTGASLPKTLEPYIRQLASMGKLLDENGDLIDADRLSFKDIEDETLKEIKNLLQDIRDLLAGLPSLATNAASALNTMVPEVLTRPKTPVIEDDAGRGRIRLPGFAGGTHGQFIDFGPGTPVMLHGREAIVPDGDLRSPGMMTVIVEQDGRAAARFVAPYLPGEVKRLRLA